MIQTEFLRTPVMDPIPLLKDLVSIPSVNPMGRDLAGDEYYETRLSDYLDSYFRRENIPFERIEVAPGRTNILARCDSPASAVTVLMDAHQDTVPVDGMVIPPYEPTIENGKLYGRGSCDIKGGGAAMLAAFTRLAKEQPPKRANVVLSLSVDEEATSLGINHLVAHMASGSSAYRLLPKPPDISVVAEPTELDIVVAHRGAVRWQIHTAGRACHSSKPQEGINAIYRMARVIEQLERFAAQLPGSKPAHRLCGPATLSVGLIAGGLSVNVVPDHCVIDIDRRVIPGEDRDEVIEEVRRFLQSNLDFDVTFDPPFIASPALDDDLNSPWSDRMLDTIERIAGPKRKIGVAYGTHASRIAAAGFPAFVFGPGNIAQAHTKDEWVDVEQVRQAAEIYFQFCCDAADGP
jgi:succinyl-diaminopimelate desuccinylase